MEVKRFVICVDNKDYESSLERWKLYPVVSEDEIEGFLRIIDESGEDYLYERRMFEEIRIPEKIEERYLLEI
jgi:hypothetical protein